MAPGRTLLSTTGELACQGAAPLPAVAVCGSCCTPAVLNLASWDPGLGFAAHASVGANATVCSTEWLHRRYWSFVQKRRWGGYKKGAASASSQGPSGYDGGVPQHKTSEHQATLRSQLAGLRHRAAIRAKRQRSAAPAAEPTCDQPEQEQDSGLEYDSSQMGDGCNLASGVTDWEAAEQQHAAQAAKRRFSATESHRQQVMQQMAGLHRRAAVQQEAGMR